jgi:citronellol/citronellal dehydrogenase
MRSDPSHMIACMRQSPTGESEIFAPGLLKDQVALVTGGGTGLGKATALELARCGAKVLIAGRRAEVLEEAVAEIGPPAPACS